MGYERTHSFQKKSSHTPQPRTQFSTRPFAAPVQMKPKEQQTAEELENEAFDQNKFEAFGLQLKEKSGTITPVEQERLGLLQAKTDDFWAQRREKASRFGFDFSKVAVNPPGEPAAPQLQPMGRLGTQGESMGGQRSPLNSLQQSSASPLQAKLTIGEPGDKYEQEADRVASQVVQQINSPASTQSPQGQSVQRQEVEEEEIQAKPEITSLQRQELPEEEELQAKFTLQRQEAIGGGEASTDLDTAINSARGGGQPLDAGLQQSMGQAMGADFSGVKVHTDSQSDQLNQSIQAKAFTTGQDVFFRQGAYQPGSRGGQELIAHELTHVVQQNGSTIQRKLMTEGDFIKISDGAFSGKRNRVLKVDAALQKCQAASSKSVALTGLIDACKEYLDIPEQKAQKRVAGVKALMKNATEELAAWRMRERKPLPNSVFRMDERSPAEIARNGFQPWNAGGQITIIEHVNQVLKADRADAPTGESGKEGKGAKKHSQWVSTSGDLNFAKDPTLLAGLLNKYFYKIDTTVDPETFTDVNKHFDEQGVPNPYEPQFEFIKSGGIPGNQVTFYVHGRELMNFVIAGTDADTWNIPWQPMPEIN